MLIAMLVLAILAVGIAFLDFARSAWTSYGALTLVLFSGSIVCYALYLLDTTGKL